MNTVSLNEIKSELNNLEPKTLASLCMRLAKYKKENKELLAYLLFEAHNESSYVEMVKETVDDLFTEVESSRNTYFVKKTIRKILRVVNKQIKYSGIKQTEVELRICFCLKVKEKKVPLVMGTVLFNLYHQQIKKIYAVLDKLPEDLQTDYQREIQKLV